MVPNLSLLIFICTFLVPQGIVLGWKRFMHSSYEAKNGTLNLLYHIFCMYMLTIQFQAFWQTIILWAFMSVAFVGMITLLCGTVVGKDFETILSSNPVYSRFKMLGHPYVIFPITMSISFFLYAFPF